MVTQRRLGVRKGVKSNFRIYSGHEVAMGPGKAALLHHIAVTGSISKAAKRMEMSYNRAWLLVRTMNRCFRQPLVAASRGGDSRGGAEVTERGKQVLKLYQRLQKRVLNAASKPLKEILSHVKG